VSRIKLLVLQMAAIDRKPVRIGSGGTDQSILSDDADDHANRDTHRANARPEDESKDGGPQDDGQVTLTSCQQIGTDE
jgi:hypothetical protein